MSKLSTSHRPFPCNKMPSVVAFVYRQLDCLDAGAGQCQTIRARVGQHGPPTELLGGQADGAAAERPIAGGRRHICARHRYGHLRLPSS